MHKLGNQQPLEAISELVGSIGTSLFPDKLFSLLTQIAKIDDCRAYVISGDNVRLLFFAGDTHIESDSGGKSHIRQPGERELAAIQSSPPRGTGNTYLLVERTQGYKIHASFTRSDGTSFDRAELASFDSYAPLMRNALRCHLELDLHKDGNDMPTDNMLSSKHRDTLLQQIRSDLLRLGTVSPREAEVCAHIVLGYNTNAISLNLGITPNTAATHRKRAYSKLGISSQNELFARYLRFARPEDQQRILPSTSALRGETFTRRANRPDFADLPAHASAV